MNRRPVGAMIKSLLFLILIAVSLALAVRQGYLHIPAFGKPAAVTVATPQEMPPMPVLAAPVELGPALDQVQTVGSLLADESVTISSEIDGRIADLKFTEGQHVKKGTVLVVLDSAEWDAVVKQGEAAVILQELKFARSSELRDKKIISMQEYDEAQAALIEARAVLALARARLAKTILSAPFSGILGMRHVSPGDYVEAGQEMVNLEAIDPLKVDFRAPERYASQLAQAKRISVRVDAYPDESFEGEVYAIEPRVDTASRNISLRARISNPEGRLLPGMFAQVTVFLDQRELALWVPEQSLLPQGDKQFVYRVVDGRAVLTAVEIGLRKPGMVEIVNGLNPGDIVVMEGQLKLYDGAAVVVTEVSAQQRNQPKA